MVKRLIAAAAFWSATNLCWIAPASAEEAKDTPSIIYLDGAEADANAAKTYKVDTIVPVAPAFALLSADTPQAIGAPFGGDSFFNIGSSGGAIPELGAAARPFWSFLSGKKMSLARYRGGSDLDTRTPYNDALGGMDVQDRVRHILGRTLLSGAVATIPGATKRAGVAIGVSTSLLDRADPRIDPMFDLCLRQVLDVRTSPELTAGEAKEIVTSLETAGLILKLDGAPNTALRAKLFDNLIGNNVAWSAVPNAVSAAYDEASERVTINNRPAILHKTEATHLIAQQWSEHPPQPQTKSDAAYDACVKKASARYLEQSDLTIGAGAFWRGKSDKNLDGLEFAGSSIWLGYRQPLLWGQDDSKTPKNERLHGQLDLYARFEQREQQTFANNLVSDSSTAIAFGSYSLESEDADWRATLAASWNSRDYSNPALASKEFSRLSGSFEHRLPRLGGVWDKAWLEIGYGALSEDVDDEESYSFVRLKIDLTQPAS